MADRRNWGIAAGVAGAAAVAAGVAWLLKSRPLGTIATPAGLTVGVLSISAAAGGVATAEIEITNPGDETQTVTLSGFIESAGVSFVAKSVTVAPGEVKSVTMQSAGPINAMFAGQQLTAVFRTDDDQEIAATFTIQGLPLFQIRVISIKSPVKVGEYAQATLEITNIGSAPGTVQINGFTLQGGVQQGTWV